MNRITPLLLVAVAMLGGCLPTPSRPPMPSNYKVSIDSSARCDCPGAKNVEVTATEGQPHLRITTLERSLYDPASAMKQSTINVQLGLSGKRRLGCTVDRDPADLAVCRIVRTFNVNGVMFPDNLADLSRERILSLVEGRLRDEQTGNAGTGQCVQQCKSNGSGCPVYDATTGGDVTLGPRIAQLVGSIKPNDNVDVASIMALTSGGTNACGRTGIAGKTGRFSNAGSRCEIKSTMGTLGAIKITIPEALQFGLSTPEVNRFTVSFDKAAGAPQILLTGASFPSTYNGAVNRVDYVDGLYVVELNHQCLGIRTKPGT